MSNRSGLEFAAGVLTAELVSGRDVLEVGARDVNGSVRSHVSSLGPRRYVGVDIESGPGVDELCPAEELVERFGRESFDVLIAMEVVEHVRDWRTVFTSMKRVLRPGGRLVLTTRSLGFAYHGYPFDFWRYELSDMRRIFADFDIRALVSDPESPGVFVAADKPVEYVEQDLAPIRLFSIVTLRRSHRVTDFAMRTTGVRKVLRAMVRKVLPKSLADRLRAATQR